MAAEPWQLRELGSIEFIRAAIAHWPIGLSPVAVVWLPTSYLAAIQMLDVDLLAIVLLVTFA
ncbi:MAG: hypothetical protein OSA42_05895 [Porticoccaceae bacterium]|nr:hypothetical protein [Porticoccaceae bacterium]